MTCLATIFTLWLATVLNFGGAKYTGRVSSVTVWGVIIPCIGLAVIGWFWFSPSLYSVNWNVHNMGFGQATLNAITMTLWAFLGMESACANADAVDNPEKNVPKAVLGGTLLAAACYIVSTNIIFGIIPADSLVSSSAPFGLVFAHMLGPDVGRLIMGLMVLSCFGSLLGWQFTIANVFKAGSDEGYFPGFLRKVTNNGTPIAGMVVITIIQSLFSLMTISPSLNDQFETLVNLAVITNIIPYLLCMAAIVVIMKASNHLGSELSKTKFVAAVASVYSLYACYASGFEAMTYGAIVTFLGWTLYGFVSDRFDLKPAEAYNLSVSKGSSETK
jgi:putrescine:ornithine antiporter